VVAADLEHLGSDEALDQCKYVGVGASLDLREQALLVGVQERQLCDLGKAVRQELLAEIELPAADYIAIGIPSNALGHLDALGIAARIGCVLHGM
jgi:hypothetical protein